MASNPPGKCCFKTFDHSGNPEGTLETLNGVLTYITGDRNSERVIIIMCDVFGPVYQNSQLIADDYAKNGYLVVIPDILFGDYVPASGLVGTIQEYLGRHTVEATEAIAEKSYEWVKSNTKAKFIGTLGYCFGAKYSVRLIDGKKDVDAASIFHPSFVSMEEVAAIKKPLYIHAAEEDNIYPENLRRDTEDKLKEIGAVYYQTLYCKTTHGFACRSDPSDKYAWAASQKAVVDTLWFFENLN